MRRGSAKGYPLRPPVPLFALRENVTKINSANFYVPYFLHRRWTFVPPEADTCTFELQAASQIKACGLQLKANSYSSVQESASGGTTDATRIESLVHNSLLSFCDAAKITIHNLLV